MTDTDVVVVGGGPVGLLLACELKLAGVEVTVLERLTEIDQTIKAGAINVPTGEAFYRRGLLGAMEDAQRRNFQVFLDFYKERARVQQGLRPDEEPVMPEFGKKTPFIGHFAGVVLPADKLDEDDPSMRGRGPVQQIGMVSQQDAEGFLGDRAIALGVDVRRGVTVTGLSESGEGVMVETDAGPVHAGWVVGCDGGRSAVRKLAGFEFPGTDPEITAYQAICDMENTEELPLGWHTTPTGTYAFGPVPGRVLIARFDGPPADREAPITVAELQDAIRYVTGVDVVVTGIKTATRFTDNARQASTYRLGRVLLAGDAAHVHSPFGGQGLNLGAGDAMNLGWKLAATIKGTAPEGLLDTYTAERHPLGAWVLDWTRAQVALMRTDPQSRALRAVVTELLYTREGTTYAAKKVAGLELRYDLGDADPRVGASARDFEFADGTRLGELLHEGTGLLLDLADGPEGAAVRAAADGYAGRVKTVTAKAVGELADEAPEAMLVRPDGVVAWIGSGADTAGLAEALRRWFGAAGQA